MYFFCQNTIPFSVIPVSFMLLGRHSNKNPSRREFNVAKIVHAALVEKTWHHCSFYHLKYLVNRAAGGIWNWDLQQDSYLINSAAWWRHPCCGDNQIRVGSELEIPYLHPYCKSDRDREKWRLRLIMWRDNFQKVTPRFPVQLDVLTLVLMNELVLCFTCFNNNQ